MRQTLTLLGTIRGLSIHPGRVREAPREIIRRLFDVHLFVQENYPGTSSLHRIEAAVRDAERPQHRAIFQARPGDRVELVGYWHRYTDLGWDGNLHTVHIFEVERFQVING